MGIAQWVAVGDAVHAAGLACGLVPGTEELRASGSVVRRDGTIVCEVGRLVCAYANAGREPMIVSTRKVGFRDMVRPGEEIFVQVKLEG